MESGRFLQRADVTDLVFTADDGTRLDAEARFETVAWPDRLALILAARPGVLPIPAGEACFGRRGGGFGLDGTNHLEIPHAPALDPEQFTLEFWVFVPGDYRASERTHPWLVCKNRHEQAEGNYGIVVLDGRPQARLNVGGGRENMFVAGGETRLGVEQWNHLAMSYDGATLRLYLDGAPCGEQRVDRRRVPGVDGLAFGRRQDNCGDGFRFRGAVDEIRFYDRALTPAEILGRVRAPGVELTPVGAWSFRSDGSPSPTKPRERWRSATLDVNLTTPRGTLSRRAECGEGDWSEVALALDPVSFEAEEDAPSPVRVQAAEASSGTSRPVSFDSARGWHCVNLDGIQPVLPAGRGEAPNDAMERVRLSLSNPSGREQVARLLFEKTAHGIRQRLGAPITGISAVLCGAEGHPTGIPVQLSKNWHNRPEGGVYAGQWFHGISQVRLPPGAEVDLELAIVYGHWGGVAAASHAQLCLIGWGSNQLWDQSALGAWGESICYEPDQAQAAAGILDVRPAMVSAMSGGQRWGWTHNVGGGDFFRLFDPAGRRVFPARMRTAYQKQGPCLTEVTYAGRTGDGVEHATTVSLARTDDLVRGTYRLRLDVAKPVEFSRFVIFQIGADTYSYTGERTMALGDEAGLHREWATAWGGDVYRTDPMACTGRVPWVSLHKAVRREAGPGAWANRGIVIRAWKARLGGRPAVPWVAERGAKVGGAETSTLDVVPPPGVARLVPGDYVEAVFEHLVVPQFAEDYYGPNEGLRAALARDADTWRMVHREAAGNDRRVSVQTGRLERLHPDVCVRTAKGRAELTLEGGLGYVPVTFAALDSPRGHVLLLDGRPLDQGVHGRDFWQADYDPSAGCWSLTFNVPVADDGPHAIRIGGEP